MEYGGLMDIFNTVICVLVSLSVVGVIYSIMLGYRLIRNYSDIVKSIFTVCEAINENTMFRVDCNKQQEDEENEKIEEAKPKHAECGFKSNNRTKGIK